MQERAVACTGLPWFQAKARLGRCFHGSARHRGEFPRVLEPAQMELLCSASPRASTSTYILRNLAIQDDSARAYFTIASGSNPWRCPLPAMLARQAWFNNTGARTAAPIVLAGITRRKGRVDSGPGSSRQALSRDGARTWTTALRTAQLLTPRHAKRPRGRRRHGLGFVTNVLSRPSLDIAW